MLKGLVSAGITQELKKLLREALEGDTRPRKMIAEKLGLTPQYLSCFLHESENISGMSIGKILDLLTTLNYNVTIKVHNGKTTVSAVPSREV